MNLRESVELSTVLSKEEFVKYKSNKENIAKLQLDFNLFELFEGVFGENAWSKLFAFFIDSTEKHNLGKNAFHIWSKVIARSDDQYVKFIYGIEERIESINIKTEWSTSEGRRIDMLIELFDKTNELIGVIGFENKIDSNELASQVSDYQKAISYTYPKARKIIMFCTPDGRESMTAIYDNSECPYIAISYSTLKEVFESLSPTVTGELKLIIRSLSKYIHLLILIRENQKILTRTYSDIKQFNKKNIYSPSIPFLNKFIEYLFAKQNRPRIPFLLWHKTFSTNVIEIRDADLGVANQLIPCYMLHSKKNPQIGDYFVVRLMVWSKILYKRASYDKNTREKVHSDIFEYLKFDDTNGKPQDWHPWVNIWTSRKYQLRDFGVNDIENMFELLDESIIKTYPRLKLKFPQYLRNNKNLYR